MLNRSEYVSHIVDRVVAPDKLTRGCKTAQHVAGLIEAGYFRDGARYLCTREPTIADIACYEEVAQLRWAGLFDFEGFPKLTNWLDGMQELTLHHEVHLYNTTLGDIRSQSNAEERVISALSAALSDAGVHVQG